MNSNVISVASESTFEMLRGTGRVNSHQIYKVDGQFAWSPDGVGFYWYETLAECEAEHGDEEPDYRV
jgi:hypothetical protein